MPSMTITTTAPQAQRLMDAFKLFTNNPDATQEDLRQWVIGTLKRLVAEQERRIAEATIAQPAPFDPT